MNPDRSATPKETLLGLLEQTLEGAFPESSREKLNSLLRQHPELISDFIEYRERCASLRIVNLERHDETEEEMSIISYETLFDETSLFPTIDTGTEESFFSPEDPCLSSSFSALTRGLFGLVTLIFVTAVIGFSLIDSTVQKLGPFGENAAPLPVVAHLIAMDQCQWKSPGAPNIPKEGDHFHQGMTLELESGLAQIHYESGG